MSVSLSNPVEASGGTSNSVGFPVVGSSVTMGLVNMEEYAQTDFDTGEAKTFSNGDPMKGTKITGVVKSAEGVEVGPKGERVLPGVGDVVVIWVEGSKHFAWRDATKAASGHNYVVGDEIWFGCVSEDKPANPRHNPRKVYEAAIRSSDNADLTDACERAYRAATAITVDAPPPSGNPFD